MIFNIFLANHPAERLKTLYDVLRPLERGLIDHGHHVIGYGLGLLPAPAVNLLVEFFPDDSFVDELLKLKAGSGERLLLGLVAAADIGDDDEIESTRYPRRRANCERVLATVDFVWALSPLGPSCEALCGAGRVAEVGFGFSQRLLNPRLIPEPQLRDLDVVIEGDATAHRREVAEALTRRGLKCHLSGVVPLPSFVTADLARRAKICLDLRSGAKSRFSSASRICKGLHNGTLVMRERGGGSPGGLDRFTVGSDPDKIVEECAAAVASGMAVMLGLAALEKFRAETSMRDGMQTALQVPALRSATT